MRRTIAAIITGAIALTFLAGCGEKPCNDEGAMKANAGKVYYCADRRDGNGLRWYEA